MTRQFIDIIIRADDGHYDFERDRAPQRTAQQSKTGDKQIGYLEVQTCPWQIYTGMINSSLLKAIAGWNLSPIKSKLKIRFNAHGSDQSPDLIMNLQGGGANSISPYWCAQWLWRHGLEHTAQDSWNLTFSMACCHAAAHMCGQFISTLHCLGVHGFKVTGSPRTVSLSNGHVKANMGPRTLLGCIPRKGNRYADWKESNGSKQVFMG